MNLTGHTVEFASLVDLAEGRLDEAERARVRAHADACRSCAEQLAQIERTVTLMRSDQSTDAPRDAVAYAVNLFHARRAAAREARPTLAERIVAMLTFDSARVAPAFGVRSAAPADTRQLMFTAGESDIELRLARAEGGWAISGQVLGTCEGGQVKIEGGETVELNELCEFSLRPIPAGTYKLLLHLPEGEVEIPAIELEA